ncbi:enoyl-CoA hydratase/isomerase family protein [Streptomyces sp. NPDC091292]|uniref:enoyl-CoA hydratase/isomerase family protein n=1 Tax=Streptomyces sp. NPDC091292 TaxID=3365991 RepID=UPI00382588A9
MRIDLAAFADGAADEEYFDEDLGPRRPLIIVGLDATVSPATWEKATERIRGHDGLLVGCAQRPTEQTVLLSRHLDLTVAREAPERTFVAVDDPEQEAHELVAAAGAHPQATAVLGQVLRATERLTVAEALDVESFAYSTLLAGREFERWLALRRERSDPPVVPQPVLLAREGDILRITFNQQDRRNAYGSAMRDALVEALAFAERDPSLKEIVLAGSGPVFSSGGDLAEFGRARDLATAHLVRTRGGAARALHRLRDRTTAQVHGACVGAGVELPAFAGRVTAAEGTTFRLPEIGMGLIPGAGGTVSIPRRIGRRRTLHLALTGRRLTAERALDWGLVDRIDAPGPS